MSYVTAFWVGGLICALCQILLEKTKLMPGRIMVGLVVSGTILGALGIYEPFIEWAGAGASVPLLGFGNSLFKGVKEAIAEKGFLGIFGKKEKPKPTVTTTMLRSLNRDMIAEQQAQSRRLSEHADSLAARNAELNRQLHGFIHQMDKKVQADLQKREDDFVAEVMKQAGM